MSPSRERLISIRLPPGVYKNGTRNQARGRWFDSNCVRWYEGIMGPVGGWRTVTLTTLAWAASTGFTVNQLIVDRNQNVQVATNSGTTGAAQPVWNTTVGGLTTDNTQTWLNLGPTGNRAALAPSGFISTWASAMPVAVGFRVFDDIGDIQTVSVAGTTGGAQPAWNHTIGGTTADNTVTWTTSTTTGFPRGAYGMHINPGATASMIAGTHTRLYTYQTGTVVDQTPAGLVVGSRDSSYGAGGYGNGPYGVGYYGTGGGGVTLTPADTWQFDNFGNLGVASLTSDGKLYSFTPGGTIATQITNAPTGNAGVVVTPERFLVALGAGGDGRKVQWADQNSTTIWGLGQGNDSGVFGSFFLATKGNLMSGRRARLQTFLWTDFDAYTMTFTGSTFGTAVYQFAQLGDNCGLIGANACVVLGNVAYWWSNQNKFFVYDGAMSPLSCDVIDFLNNDVNFQQKAKIFGVSNAAFDEVTWFYPSVINQTLECDSYVTYNFRLRCWYTGRLGIETGVTATRWLGRSVGVDKGTFDQPIYVDSHGQIWEHEIANSRSNVGLIFADSGPVSLADVDIGRMYGGAFDVGHVGRYIPDEKTLGDTQLTLFGNMLLTDPEYSVGPFSAAAPTQLRFLARNIRIRVQEKNAVLWRVGAPQLGVVPGGRR